MTKPKLAIDSVTFKLKLVVLVTAANPAPPLDAVLAAAQVGFTQAGIEGTLTGVEKT